MKQWNNVTNLGNKNLNPRSSNVCSEWVINHITAKNTEISRNFLVWKFVETHNFRRVSDDSPATLRELYVPKNFRTKKLGEIMVYHAVQLHWTI